MDWIQFPFEVDAKLLRGVGAPVVRLRWVFTDLPFLPVGTGSVINNRIWNEDQESDLVVGQLPLVLSNYKQDARWRLPAGLTGKHQCHPEWFPTGEPFPNDLPPAIVGAYLIPECCGLFQDVTAGGAVIGGSVGDRYYPPSPTSGGVVIGGSIVDVYRPPDATAGGVEIGGAIGEVYRPPDATAGGVEIGGAVGDVRTDPDPTEGGIEIGGETGDVQTGVMGSWERHVGAIYAFTAEFTGDHDVRLYGAGGKGGDASTGGGMDLGGGGGGGGAFSHSVFSLTAGTTYFVQVGRGGEPAGPDGEESVMRLGFVELIKAKGGAAGSGTVGGAGGDATAGIGAERWSGGNGADSGPVIEGGGGGGSACYAPTGIPPGTGGDGMGQVGGVPPYVDGSHGGDGGFVSSGGNRGGFSGGGGGGAGAGATDPGGDGFDGRILIYWPA